MMAIKKNICKKDLLKLPVIFIFLMCFNCLVKAQTTPSQNTISVIQNGNPSDIQLTNFIGEKIDLCIERQVKTRNVSDLVAPFYNKTEVRWWQSEFWGKWMLSAVLSYRYTNDPVLLDSIQFAVKGLLGSQSPNGYIGNYSEDAQLEQWDVWGRKYSLLGLLAYYDLTGDKKVLKACSDVANHLMTQVGPGKVNIVSTGNYLGMASSSILEPILYLYQRTKDKRYLDFAEYIVGQWETEDGPQLISKAEAGIPVAERFPHPRTMGKSWFGVSNGQKAYEMMSCYEGLLELYKITKNEKYLSAVEKTVESIIDAELNLAGSGSAFECWYHGKELQTRPTYHTMETCVTMTWMKLCQNLLGITGNPVYADHIEKTAYNAMLASMKDDASEIAKYSPLEGQRHPGENQSGMLINCCNANGPRAFALLPQVAVMQSSDNEIFVNLYTGFSSTINLSRKTKVQINQQTNYPVDGKVEMEISIDKPQNFTVALRIPEWSLDNSITVNGEKLSGEIIPGSYHKINRQWKKNDKIVLDLDVRGRLVKYKGYFAIEKGPVVLARDSRFDDGFIDEAAQVSANDNYVELIPVSEKPRGIWMAFTAPLVLGTDLEGDAKIPKQIHFCDFSSAGNTWSHDVRYRVWIPETLNATRAEYKSYN